MKTIIRSLLEVISKCPLADLRLKKKMHAAINILKSYKYNFLILNLVSHFDVHISSFTGKQWGNEE